MKAGIVGYGKMGRSIFGLLGDSPLEVVVLVRDPAKAEDNNRRLEKRLRRSASSGVLDQADLAGRLASLRFASSWDDLRDCDLVIETVVEDYETKIEVLRQIEQTVSPEAVITSNSSSLSINRMASSLKAPSRFCGFHFFHPIPLTSVVEIITAEHTAPRTVDFLRKVLRGIGRVPLVVKDLAGSCINVALIWLSCEALYILEQGLALPSQIDAVAGRFARIGPCESLDVTGIPFFTDVLDRTLKAYPFDLVVPELCHKLIRDGRLGKYAGKGIYLYCDDRPTDDAMEYYVNPGQGHSRAAAQSEGVRLYERLLFPIYFSVLYLTQMGLGEVRDFCLGIQDLIGLKIDPLEEMHAMGSDGLREMFERLRLAVGSRYDCGPIAGAMAALGSAQRRQLL